MLDVKTSTIIKRSIAEVSAYTSDPDNAPEWYVNIHSAEWKTPKPLRVGAMIAFKAKFLRRELAYTYEIVEYDPLHKLVMRTAEGPFPMETTYTYESINDHTTRVTLRNAGKPRGFSRLFAPFMKGAMRRANQKDLEKLKELLERQ
jgi:hypothetical protein